MPKSNYKEKWYSLEESEMQDLLYRAKRGDAKAQDKLLEVFDNFLSKYVQLLYDAKYNLNLTETRSFIALYVKNPKVRYPLLKNQLNAQGYKDVAEVIRGVQGMVRRYGNQDDVEQTVRMAFLHAVNKYERKESKSKPGEFVPFAGYLSRYFKFVIKRYVDDFLIDQNGRHTYAVLPDDPSAWEHEDGSSFGDGTALPLPPGQTLEEMVGAEMLDEYWVVGDSAFYPFNTLTIQERQLLRWRYVDNLKASEIAHRITEHPNTLRDHFNKIRNKLLEELNT